MITRTCLPVTVSLYAALCLSWVPDLWAQADEAPSAVLYRPMLSARFRNVGNQDGFYKSGTTSTPQYLFYPNNRNGGGAYGTARIRSTSSAHVQVSNPAVRVGHGVWTMTSDGRVVYTGVRMGMQADHIVPMQYDVSADPDLSLLGRERYSVRRPTVKLGYGVRYPTGVEETDLGANWWPGSDLIEEGRATEPTFREPVHIYNWNFSAYPTHDGWPEEIIVTQCTNSQGLTMTERASAWSHPDFDDLFLDEYIIENTGDTNGDGVADLPLVTLSDLYIGFQDRFNNGASGQQAYHRYWTNDEDWCMDDWYVYDRGRKLLYTWDGDHPLYHSWDDSGDPYYVGRGIDIGQQDGTLMSPAHLGVAAVAYTDDAASRFRFNARDAGEGYVIPEGDQPCAVRFWEAYNTNSQADPNNLVMTEAQIYAEVMGPGRRIDPDPAGPSGQFSMLIFGPYDLPAGGKLKIVLAYVAGHPGQVMGNTDMFTWARKGNRSELPRGLDALRQNVEAARFAYANAFDIPDAPPDVNFRTGSNATAQMRVDWPADVEAARHPDAAGSAGAAGSTGAAIAGYRVYRSTWLAWGPWEFVADIPAGTTSLETPAYRVSREGDLYVLEDLRSAAGFFYHYSVRAYAGPVHDWSPGSVTAPLGFADLPGHIQTHLQLGQEGGRSAPTQRTYADESPFAVPSPDTEALRARIRVVPHPYRLDASHTYPSSTKIRFVGVPSRCRIRVFSASGDLVSDVPHDDATRAEHDYDQNTVAFNGAIATGVYFWVVENRVPGSDFGRLQKGTFMVIQ